MTTLDHINSLQALWPPCGLELIFIIALPSASTSIRSGSTGYWPSHPAVAIICLMYCGSAGALAKMKALAADLPPAPPVSFAASPPPSPPPAHVVLRRSRPQPCAAGCGEPPGRSLPGAGRCRFGQDTGDHAQDRTPDPGRSGGRPHCRHHLHQQGRRRDARTRRPAGRARCRARC